MNDHLIQLLFRQNKSGLEFPDRFCAVIFSAAVVVYYAAKYVFSDVNTLLYWAVYLVITYAVYGL